MPTANLPTLHIEHPVTDLAVWRAAFAGFAEVRRRAGVVGEAVRHPVGDEAFVVVDLEFPTVEQAEAFRRFLEAEVWAVPERSPALAGAPQARVLLPAWGPGPERP
jgi:hypothetical protein